MSILKTHGQAVELAPVLASLPPATPLHRLAAFLTASLEARVSARHSTALLRALHHSEHLLLQEERVAVEGARVDLTEATVCRACGRRFQTLTAFYRSTTFLHLHSRLHLNTHLYILLHLPLQEA